MMRKILAGLAGVVAAIVAIALIQMLSHLVYAPPGNIDRNDPAAVRAFVASLPTGAFLSVLVSYAVGTIVGSRTAAWVARGKLVLFAAIIGAVVLAAAIANVMMIPHPAWFVIALFLVVPAAAAMACIAAWRSRNSADGIN